MAKNPSAASTAEAHLIGAVLLDGSVMDDIASDLSTRHFADADMRVIYAAALKLWRGGSTVEPVAVLCGLDDRHHQLVEDILASTATAANARHYAEQVRTEATRRDLKRVARRIDEGADDKSCDPKDIVEEAATSLHSLTVAGDEVVYGGGGGLAKVYKDTEERWASGTTEVGIPTPFKQLDHYIGGWEPGLMYVLGARPSVGKSALALQFAMRAAKLGKHVMWAGCEGTSTQLYRRTLAGASGVSVQQIKRGDLTADEWVRLAKAGAKVKPMLDNMALLFRPGLTPDMLRAHSRKCQRTFGLDMLVIDYLQLMKPGVRTNSTYESVTHVSHEVNNLAMDLDIPVIALSQLSRGMEGQAAKGKASGPLATESEVEMRQPTLSSLRNSGDIEQDAATVMFIHRVTRGSTAAEILIAKQRDGECEVGFDLTFDKTRILFEEE